MEHIFPVLSPIALDDGLIATIPALQISLLCTVLSEEDAKPVRRFVLFSLPNSLPRHITVPDAEGASHAYLNLEDVLELFITHYFPSEKVTACARFRISRNSDIVAEDHAEDDLAAAMEGILDKRLKSPAIRIEIEEGARRDLVTAIRQIGVAQNAQVFTIPGELDLSAFFAIAGLPGFDELKVEPWATQNSAQIEPGESLFDAIKRGDILMHHPYASPTFTDQ